MNSIERSNEKKDAYTQSKGSQDSKTKCTEPSPLPTSNKVTSRNCSPFDNSSHTKSM